VDVLRPVRRFDEIQQRHRALAFPLAVVRKFGNDQGGNLAALVAYYAFFSLFPLLLVFVTILGFVLHGHPGTLHSVEASVQKNFPGFNKLLQIRALHGSVVALVLGLVASLWSGLGVTGAAQNALDTVWAVPFKHRPDFLKSKLRGIGLLIVLGVLFIAATAASGVVSGGLGGPLAKVGGIVVSFLVNCVLYLAAFRLMTAKSIETRCLRVGVVVAALFWTILQSIGGIYIHHVVSHMSAAYALFATVIPLLIWLHLGAQMTLYAAEVNVVLQRRLWPRSLMGPPVERADRETLTALAKVEERSTEEVVDVSFAVGAESEHDGSPNDEGDADGDGDGTPSSGDPRRRPPIRWAARRSGGRG
jgi:YihY family inner membrane protein